MKKWLHILYAAVVVMIALFFIYLCAYTGDEVFQTRDYNSYTVLTEYEYEWVENDADPVGGRDVYRIQISGMTDEDRCLVFYAIHQSVEIYIGDELVYSLYPDEENYVTGTPGKSWITIPVYGSDEGKELRVELVPAYSNLIGEVSDFYFGSETQIVVDIVRKNILIFVLSALSIAAGIVLIVTALYTYQKSKMDESTLMLGMFALWIGLWKLTDMELIGLVFRHSIAAAYVPYFALYLLEIPFLLYVREFFSPKLKGSRIWYLTGFASIAVTSVSLAMQIFAKRDLRRSLMANHVILALLLLVVSVMSMREIRTNGWNKKLKKAVACLVACMIGVVADLFVYYSSNGTSTMVMSMACIFCYIVVMGIDSMLQTHELLVIGRKATQYEQMAYHDQLTGLYNRVAYSEHLGEPDFTPEHYIVVMFDLNDLKTCNDTRGHDKGDQYISVSAQMIKQCFGDIGRCYRMGGDEFCVLLENVLEGECIRRIHLLQEQTDVYNRENPGEYPVKIACGYACYDRDEDFDLGDTMRRADKKMYVQKIAIKQRGILTF